VSYLSKSLAVDQEIVVQLTADADREEVARRLGIDGVRLKVLERSKRDMFKLGVIAPAGLTPVKREKEYSPGLFTVGSLSLTRAVGDEIVVTLRNGADSATTLDWLASEGLVFQVAVVRARQVVINVRAVADLLILRDELELLT
jgi:hypothetical protein